MNVSNYNIYIIILICSNISFSQVRNIYINYNDQTDLIIHGVQDDNNYIKLLNYNYEVENNLYKKIVDEYLKNHHLPIAPIKPSRYFIFKIDETAYAKVGKNETISNREIIPNLTSYNLNIYVIDSKKQMIYKTWLIPNQLE
jgi:hypothetical protein